MRKKGFTIVEMMVVIAMMGIIGSIAIPSFRNYIVRMRLTRARDEILSTLKLARARAMSERIVYRVSFNTADSSYSVGKDPDGDGTFTYEGTKPLPNGISFQTSGSDFEFYPDRTGAVLTSDLIIINTKNEDVRFYIIPATGHIKVEE
ncbi:prepilin-type N-terminal cleavage/methylation domain-containing protein [candidate division WOR-3 bacterium]|nr:prepilin-type N-terminal cleavage/methylation domain-containing protein [candidate division WOR-3 bacterium]